MATRALYVAIVSEMEPLSSSFNKTAVAALYVLSAGTLIRDCPNMLQVGCIDDEAFVRPFVSVFVLESLVVAWPQSVQLT